MADQVTTYEDVERAANAIKTTRGPGGSPIQQFCGFWPMIKNILHMVRLMLSKNVRDKVDQAIQVCDALCVAGGGG
jgi:hypothetical protein